MMGNGPSAVLSTNSSMGAGFNADLDVKPDSCVSASTLAMLGRLLVVGLIIASAAPVCSAILAGGSVAPPAKLGAATLLIARGGACPANVGLLGLAGAIA